jgi:hypothetical protein
MKTKLFAASAALALAAVAASAASATSAQTVSGTVNVTGSVASKCAVIPGGGSTFTGTIALGELALADGTLDTSLSGATNTSSSFRVNCNTAAPKVTISATRLHTGDATTAPSGYAKDVNYTARVAIDLANATTVNTDYLTDTLPTATTATLTPIANAANNVRVSVVTPHTLPDATQLLVAGSYASTISVTISPT